MYRKFKADAIFNGYEMLPAESVLVLHPDGSVADIIRESDAGEGVEVVEGLLSPGFVNCHCHLELSYLKGRIPRHTGLIRFLQMVMGERNAAEDIIMAAISHAEQEMLQNGIVAVGDICNTLHTLQQKRCGNIRYHSFIEVAGFPENIAEKRFISALQQHDEFTAGQQSASIVPHAPYSVSMGLLDKITSFPANEILTMHNQESLDETHLYERKEGGFLAFYDSLGISTEGFKATGSSSFRTFLPHFPLNRPLILVHNVHTTADDIGFAQTMYAREDAPLYFCLCPAANSYISDTIPDPGLFLQNDMKLVLGTDSLASNDKLSIWNEILLLRDHYPDISLQEMLTWATTNGARALKMDGQLGSFESGKKPGVVLIGREDTCTRLI